MYIASDNVVFIPKVTLFMPVIDVEEHSALHVKLAQSLSFRVRIILLAGARARYFYP